jgi:hypothetical protein
MAPRVSLVKDINFIQNLISAEPKAKVVKAIFVVHPMASLPLDLRSVRLFGCVLSQLYEMLEIDGPSLGVWEHSSLCALACSDGTSE